ncbi:MAG: ATP-binding protein [Deltaproteobacteria bacterium]|nr:ATP-binding protein [Deltaproteobacteria bacterium]
MLCVSDTGAGMDRKTLSKIFDPFFSTKQMSSRRGTGLGLSVTKKIVEQLGGHIKCESEPGQGTECKVFLPAIDGFLITANNILDNR